MDTESFTGVKAAGT